MTKEQYKKRHDDIQSQITNLQRSLSLLKEEYIKHSPFKVGDKVKAMKGTKEVECFISEVKVRWGHEYDYSFTKPKKDGTMGAQGAGIFFPEKIELLTSK